MAYYHEGYAPRDEGRGGYGQSAGLYDHAMPGEDQFYTSAEDSAGFDLGSGESPQRGRADVYDIALDPEPKAVARPVAASREATLRMAEQILGKRSANVPGGRKAGRKDAGR
jgi:hypothetical protein